MTYRHFLFFALFPVAVVIMVPWALVSGLLYAIACGMQYPLLALSNDGGGLDRIKAWVIGDKA